MEKRKKELSKILEKDSYIIEGVYYSWLKDSFKLSEIIIILNNSVFLRDYRLIKRFFKRKFNPVKSKEESLKNFLRLLRWNHKYDNNNLKKAVELIKNYNENNIICKSYSDILKLF